VPRDDEINLSPALCFVAVGGIRRPFRRIHRLGPSSRRAMWALLRCPSLFIMVVGQNDSATLNLIPALIDSQGQSTRLTGSGSRSSVSIGSRSRYPCLMKSIFTDDALCTIDKERELADAEMVSVANRGLITSPNPRLSKVSAVKKSRSIEILCPRAPRQ